jgi:SEC-C motif-containing protein
MTATDGLCPCGSGAPFSTCCEPVIRGEVTAATPELLMRARYSAYTRAEVDFLFASTHPAHRKGYDHDGTRRWAEQSEWLGLEIIAAGGVSDTAGDVEFVARYRDGGVEHAHHELAMFRKHEDRWHFADGRMVGPKPIVSTKIGRNEPCPCGSGTKYKKCCGG